MTSDPRVDTYIENAPEFARPILVEIRARIRSACPSAQETIKWNVPFFVLDGKLLASMAAFKQHAKAGVWEQEHPIFVDMTSLEELPPAEEFGEIVRLAACRIQADSGPAAPAKKASPAKKAAKKAAPKKKATKKAARTIRKR